MADAVGLIALSLTCLSGCVKGLVVLSRAKFYNRDISDTRLRAELTLHSLTTWAEEAGLMQEPPTLSMSTINAALVPKILGQLEMLLLDLRQLEQRYGLRLEPTSENLEALYDDDTTRDATNPQQYEYINKAVAIFCKRKEPWKRLKWVTLDDKKFDHLLNRIRSYISELEKFLERAKQENRDRSLELFFREAILNANGQLELDAIGTESGNTTSKYAIAAAAKLKQTRLKIGFSSSTSTPATATLSESSSASLVPGKIDLTVPRAPSVETKIMKLSMRLLTLSRSARAQPFRTLAQYNNRAVLLEWKNVAHMTDLTISRRVNQVATLLQVLGPMFHSLQCRGFVEDRIAKRFGYIYDLPDELGAPSRASRPIAPATDAIHSVPELRSLRQALEQTNMPSLNLRLSHSLILLENLLNLHTSGWLHKEFRSDNVILIRGTNDICQSINQELSTYSVYIAGYTHSRVDNPGELTEPLQSDFEADLYHHPSTLCDPRQPYHKGLDIFGVGCILLEIGLWSSLRRILEIHNALRPNSTSSSLPNRSTSDLTQVSSNILRQSEDEDKNDEKPLLDLMKLRHELLLSPLTTHTPRLTSLTTSNRSSIMASLEAATGSQYRGIVEDFLTVGNKITESKANEDEFALDLETRARDTVRAIVGAI
ncbi:MAG: hypothetical protein Q9164_004850 [Protoblastenia rupestris]